LTLKAKAKAKKDMINEAKARAIHNRSVVIIRERLHNRYTALYWPMSAHASLTGLQHIQCTDSVIMP